MRRLTGWAQRHPGLLAAAAGMTLVLAADAFSMAAADYVSSRKAADA